MSLDMYLSADRYISGYLEEDLYRKLKEFVNESMISSPIPENDPNGGGASFRMPLAYWRNANHIHHWFVQNCQGGIDECQDAYVSEDDLVELLEVCQELLEVRNVGEVSNEDIFKCCEKKLPTVRGFFFGSTEFDEYYWDQIEYTAEIIEQVLTWIRAEQDAGNYWSIIYRSSW